VIVKRFEIKNKDKTLRNITNDPKICYSNFASVANHVIQFLNKFMKKRIIKILSHLFPNQIVNFAYGQLTNPQIKKLRENELKVLHTAKKEILPFEGFDIQTYMWQGGAEKILLIHGWEGQAGNFADLIIKLVEQNYTVYSFDGPSHGFSSRGRTSLFEFSALIGLLIRKLGVKKLVSHSFGGIATTFALSNNQDLAIDKYALLTTPDRFSDRIDGVARQVGITEKVKNRLIERLNKETGMDVKTLNASDFVKSVNVKKALIIHDKNDGIIPMSQSKNVQKNWAACDYMEVEGTGHFRILRTDSVLDKTLFFLRD
jgi:predicted alpha/beta hydrolase family esterase